MTAKLVLLYLRSVEDNVFARVVRSAPFRHFITATIVLAGVLVGLETYPSVAERYGTLIYTLDAAILGIFIVELAFRLMAYGQHPFQFFRKGWNVFDFVIIMACVLPLHAGYLAVFRMLRILRVLRLVSVLPRLQLLVGTLLRSIPSLGYIIILLSLIFYIYACVGTVLFGKNDPIHFGSLHISMISLFQIVTLEDWSEIMYLQMYGSHIWDYSYPGAQPTMSVAQPVAAVLYFISFVLIGTMIVLNLFIGVIMRSMEETQLEATMQARIERRKESGTSIAEELEILGRDLDRMRSHLSTLAARLVKPER